MALRVVHLTVASVERQVAFYRQAMGVTLHWQEPGRTRRRRGRFAGAHGAAGRPAPLDQDELFAHLPEGERLDAPLPPETKMGHKA